MHRYRMLGPSGPMETMAKSVAKARQNFMYRLVHECGMSWYDAREYDFSDIRIAD